MIARASKYYRKSFGLKHQVQGDLQHAYESDLITRLRNNGNILTSGNVTIRLAEAFGFCWGVDRAVSMAYEARHHFPDKHIWITNEIIHNPVVNSKLREMNIDFVPLGSNEKKDFSSIGAGDVVILPAFGASVEEMKLLESKSCEIVDTTCPWVSRVWNRVARYQQGDFTAILHGKYKHEETVATSSRARHYLIIQNLKEARAVCRYILEGGERTDFLRRFKEASSPGFDPDMHLTRLGVANQTTMLKGETEQIGKLFEQTMLCKYGPEHLHEHFVSPGDTICNATQERQDAMLQLVDEPLDVILVIGGYNSSNTGHLYEIAAKNSIRAYHIDGPMCIGPGNRIAHKLPSNRVPLVEEGWLKAGPVVIGITAGASTPDQVVAEVIERVLGTATELESSSVL